MMIIIVIIIIIIIPIRAPHTWCEESEATEFQLIRK